MNTSFGWEVGGGVDLSGDGVSDLLAAQPRENGPGATSGIQGAMNVICGRTGARLWKLYGTPETTEKFGDRFDLLTDLTGDAFGDGQLCLAPPILRLTPAATDEDGKLVQAFPFGRGHGALVTPGSTWHFQTWYRDPASPATYNLSDALRILFTP